MLTNANLAIISVFFVQRRNRFCKETQVKQVFYTSMCRQKANQVSNNEIFFIRFVFFFRVWNANISLEE